MKKKNVLYPCKRRLSLVCLGLVGLLSMQEAKAQVSISQLSSYTQNFDGLTASGTGTWTDNSTVPGWYAANGSTASTAIIASAGASSTVGLKSYGSASASDRSIGC